MTRRLGDEDRRTIDLLLDGAAKTGAGNGNGNGHSHAGDTRYNVSHHGIAASDRVSAAKQVLHLLDALPADEPSADLLTRTMRRIERRSSQRDEIRAGVNPAAFSPGSQPHA